MKKRKLFNLLGLILLTPVMASCDPRIPTTSVVTENEFVNVEDSDQQVLNKMFKGEKISLDTSFAPIATVEKVFKIGKESGKETNCYLVSKSTLIMGDNVNIKLYVHVVNGIIKAIDHDGALTTDSFSSYLPQLESMLQKYIGTDGTQEIITSGVTISSNAINSLIQDAINADKGTLKNTYSIEIRHAPSEIKVDDTITLNVLYDVNGKRVETLPNFKITISDETVISVKQTNNTVTLTGVKVSETPVSLTLTHPEDKTVSSTISIKVIAKEETTQNMKLTATTGTTIKGDLYKSKSGQVGFLLMNFDIEDLNKVDTTTPLEFKVLDQQVVTAQISPTGNRLLNINYLKVGTTTIEVWAQGYEYTKLTLTVEVVDTTPTEGNYTMSTTDNKTEYNLYYDAVPKVDIVMLVRDQATQELNNNIPLVLEIGDSSILTATVKNNRTVHIEPTKTKEGTTTVKVSLQNFPNVSMTFNITVKAVKA